MPMIATEITVYYDADTDSNNPGWVVSYRDANGYECHDALEETDPQCWGFAILQACKHLDVGASDVTVERV